MSGSLFIAFVLAALTATGGRDQLLIARLCASHTGNAGNGGVPLLVTGVICATLTASFAAWAGGAVDAMISDAAETMLVAFALGLAGAELLWPHREKSLREPTRSLGAIALVLLARQISDGPRFIVFALAAAMGAPLLTGIGGALGGAAAIALGWAMRDAFERRLPLRMIRAVMGLAVLIAALVIGLTARGIIA